MLNVARYDIDKLRHARLEGDPGRCARLLEGLRGEGRSAAADPMGAGERDPHAGKPLRRASTRTSARRPESRAGVRRSAPPAEEARAQRLRSPGQLKAALMQAARIDRMIKGSPGEVWDEFLLLMLKLRRHRGWGRFAHCTKGCLIADCPIARR